MTFTTIILAGGKSSRMGSDKALIPYSGKPLIRYSIELAQLFTTDIIISANSHNLDYLGFPVVNDIFTVKAPLAGIHAGMKSGIHDWNLVLTCDMPNITKELIDSLLSAVSDDLRMVVPFHDGFLEPLCGFYHRGLIPLIERKITENNLSLLDLPGLVPHRFIQAENISGTGNAGLFRNVNERKDLVG